MSWVERVWIDYSNRGYIIWFLNHEDSLRARRIDGDNCPTANGPTTLVSSRVLDIGYRLIVKEKAEKTG